jgi:uncharacterized protein
MGSADYQIVKLLQSIFGIPTLSRFLTGARSEGYQNGMEAYEAGDYGVALREFRLLAEQGDGMAQFRLGNMYRYGQGVAQDNTQGWEWMCKAAKQGDGEVHARLSAMYGLDLYGVVLNYKKAAAWWYKSARQGNVEAQYNIGNMHYKGQGMAQNHTKSSEWWQKAAEQGHGMAQFRLGRLYRKGEGVVLDYEQAYMWLLIASEHGQEMSGEFREEVVKSMTDIQIANAQRLAREWVEKRPK